ncbi:MAG: metal-dependent hydrolase [Candidatus Helarchaeota archaeon]
MPDWVAHICISFIIIWVLGKTRLNSHRGYFNLFMLGSVMPDLERPLSYLFSFVFENVPFLHGIFYSTFCSLFHTLVGVFIISLVLTSFFPDDNAKLVYFSFAIGGVLHLLLDSIMWPWPGMGIQWFWPIPWRFSFLLVWPGDPFPLIISGTIALILIGVDLIVFKRFYIYDLSDKLDAFFKNKSTRNI